MRRRTRAPLVTIAAGVIALSLGVGGPSLSEAAASTAVSPGSDVPGDPYIDGLKALAPTNTWAVGSIPPDDGSAYGSPWAGRWDGSRWHRSHLPLPLRTGLSLGQVDASSAANVWAVGPRYGATGVPMVALHFDGQSWHRTPIVQRPEVTLNSLSVLSPTDVWAVGWIGFSSEKPFAEHWDGQAWTISDVYTAPPAEESWLRSSAAVSAGDVWAVGGTWRYRTGEDHSLVEHWGGHRWSRVPSPSLEPLTAAAAVASDDVWAAGGHTIQHWDGHSWKRVATPKLRAPTISSMSARSADDIWAAGVFRGPDHKRTYETLMLHWDGSAWTQVPVEGGPSDFDSLYTVSADAGDDAWTAGHSGDERFVRHWDGTTWS